MLVREGLFAPQCPLTGVLEQTVETTLGLTGLSGRSRREHLSVIVGWSEHCFE